MYFGCGLSSGVDRLSFEFDKKRRENRANAKAGILLAHINRVEAFAKREQVVAEQHENLRLAAKAMHRHEHYARLLKEVCSQWFSIVVAVRLGFVVN